MCNPGQRMLAVISDHGVLIKHVYFLSVASDWSNQNTDDVIIMLFSSPGRLE